MVIYRTKEGDTLTSVARAHGVLPTDLLDLNRLPSDGSLPVGRALLVRSPGRIYHTEAGDTVKRIARSHRTSIPALLRLNPTLCDGDALSPGTSVTVESGDAPLGAISVLGFALEGTPPEEIAPYLPYLSYLAILSCRIGGEGSLALPEDTALVAAARQAGVVPLLTLSAAGDGGAEGERARISSLLLSGAYERTVDALVPALRKRGYGGVLLDFGRIPGGEEEAYTALLVRLRHRLGHTAAVMASLPPEKEEDLASLGRAAGSVLLETHAFASHLASPAPAAPYDKVEREARRAATDIRPQKLLLGLSTRALDFSLAGGCGRVLPFSEVERKQEAGGRSGYDPIGHFPYLGYREGEEERILFFEDAESLYKKLLLADALGLGGVALYPTVGTDPVLLSLIATLFRIVKPHGE